MCYSVSPKWCSLKSSRLFWLVTLCCGIITSHICAWDYWHVLSLPVLKVWLLTRSDFPDFSLWLCCFVIIWFTAYLCLLWEPLIQTLTEMMKALKSNFTPHHSPSHIRTNACKCVKIYMINFWRGQYFIFVLRPPSGLIQPCYNALSVHTGLYWCILACFLTLSCYLSHCFRS